eukprot:15435358-Alexandrium_andersonii.AAC.1
MADDVDLAAGVADPVPAGEGRSRERRAGCSTLYASLASLTEFRAQVMAQAAPNRNGREAWRRLAKRLSAFAP